MRQKPFDLQEEEVAEPRAGEQNHRISLADRLKQKAFMQTESEKKEEPEAQTETTTGSKEPGKKEVDGSGTFEDGGDENGGFEKFVEKVEEKLSQEDAMEVAEMLVQMGNIGRMFFLPNIYEGFMFPGQERIDVRAVTAKAVENEKENKAPDEGFNNYEKRLYAKIPKLREAIENTSYTEPEIKTLAKYVAREIQDVGVSKWIHKHMWLLYLLYLETKHAKNVFQGRANDFFTKKFGG